MSDDLRDQLADALCFQREAGYVTVAAADLVAVVDRIAWERAARELRRAAEDGARQRVGLPQTWNWLRDRADQQIIAEAVRRGIPVKLDGATDQ